MVPGEPHRHQGKRRTRCPQPQPTGQVHHFAPTSCQTSSHHPSESLAQKLVSTVAELTAVSITKSTKQSYAASWSLFKVFAEELNLCVNLPIPPHVIPLFVAYLFQKGFAPTTIRSHLSAIAYSHRIAGFHSPTDSFLVNKMLKGIANSNCTMDQRYPITLPILHSLLNIIPKLAPSAFQASLFSAMFATAFYGFLRCGEMCDSPHNIQFHQVQCDEHQSFFDLTFLHFKHSNPGKPFVIRIVAKETMCPVKLLLHYLEIRGTLPGPLFCTADMKPISRARFSNFLNSCLSLLKLPVKHYKAHSFRIGAATSALLSGRSESEIQILGRWSSTAFKKYLRLSAIASI